MTTIDTTSSIARNSAFRLPSNTIAYANTAQTNQNAVIRGSDKAVNQDNTNNKTTTSDTQFSGQGVLTTSPTVTPSTGASTGTSGSQTSSEYDGTITGSSTSSGTISTGGTNSATAPVQVSQTTLASYNAMTSKVDKLTKDVLGSKYKDPGNDHGARTAQVQKAYEQLKKSTPRAAEQFKTQVLKLGEPFQLNFGFEGQTKLTIDAEHEAVRAAAAQQFYGSTAAKTDKDTSTAATNQPTTNTTKTETSAPSTNATSTPGTSGDLTLSQRTKNKLADIQYLGCSEGVTGLESRLRSNSKRRGEGSEKVSEGTVLDTFKMSTHEWSEIKGRIDLTQGTAGVARQLWELSNNVPRNVMSSDPTQQTETATTA